MVSLGPTGTPQQLFARLAEAVEGVEQPVDPVAAGVANARRLSAPMTGGADVSGPSVVACVPVLAPDGSHAGSFEIGLDYGPMLDDLNESFDLVSTLFVLEAPLRALAAEGRRVSSGDLERPNDAPHVAGFDLGSRVGIEFLQTLSQALAPGECLGLEFTPGRRIGRVVRLRRRGRDFGPGEGGTVR